MTNDPFSGWVDVRLENDHYSVQPGKTTVIPVEVTNQGSVVDHLEFSLEGIVPEWLGAPLPLIMLPVGETRQVSLVIQPPTFPQVHAGVYPLLLRVSSLRLQARFVEVDLKLTVAAVQHEGPTAAFLSQSVFEVHPGEQVTFPLVLANWDLEPRAYTIGVEGISAHWFKALSSRASLHPGQETEITLVVSPPRHAESGAGVYAFSIVITPEGGSSEPVRLPCQMTITSFFAYRLNLLTPYIPPGEQGILQVQNLGNSADIYTLHFQHPREALEFHVLSPEAEPVGSYQDSVDQPRLDPWGIADPDGRIRIRGDQTGAYKGLLLHIPSGETLTIEFSPVPLEPPAWQEKGEPFTIQADSARLDRQTQEGVAAVAPVAYPWLVRITLGLFLISFMATFLVFGAVMKEAQAGLIAATRTPTATILVIRWTATITATPTETALPPTGTVIPPTPTWTAVFTDTGTPAGTPTVTVTGTLVTPTTTVTTLPSATPTATRPALTPVITIPVFPIQDTGRIAMSSDFQGTIQIFSYNTSSLTFEPVKGSSGGNDHQPAWSPDGRRLAFATDKEGQSEIYVLNLENGVVFNLTNHPGEDTDPTWSPDGGKIAFTTNRDGNLEIYAADVNTYAAVNLTQNSANDQQPDWFLDQRIAFVSDRTQNQDVFIMNPDGSGQTNLTNNPAADFQPAGARNGSRLAFVSDRDQNLEIYTMTLDGGGLVNLTNSPESDEAPAWSPDSLWIAFATDRRGNWDIFVMGHDGANPFNLTSLPSSNERAPAWNGNP